MTRLRRSEAGFGLVELIIAMSVLNIGLLTLVAALNSGALALSRASKLSTAATLADQQMELYRSLRYAELRLDDTELTGDSDSLYTGDSAWNDTLKVVDTTPGTTACESPIARECDPSREVTGPDGGKYRIDVYVIEDVPQGLTQARPVRIVTVVVRDGYDSSRTYVRQQTTFDQSTAG